MAVTDKTAKAGSASNKDRKPADAWVNISLPVKNADGSAGHRKLGGIPLDLENPLHKQFIEAAKDLSETDFSAFMGTLLSRSSVTFNVQSADSANFTLG